MVIGAVAEGTRASDAPRGRPGLDVVWAALATVPDPEIPVISIVELGIVRDVAWEGRGLVVKVTPTYSGCPATEMINTLIREALAVIGVPDVVLVNQLSPPWSTDWIAPEARTRLNGYGIAPPHVIGRTRRCGGHQSAAPRQRRRALSPLRVRKHAAPVAVRLDRVQGAIPVSRLPRAVRLFQAALRLPSRP